MEKLERLPVKPSPLEDDFKEKLEHWKAEISERSEEVMAEIMDEVSFLIRSPKLILSLLYS